MEPGIGQTKCLASLAQCALERLVEPGRILVIGQPRFGFVQIEQEFPGAVDTGQPPRAFLGDTKRLFRLGAGLLRRFNRLLALRPFARRLGCITQLVACGPQRAHGGVQRRLAVALLVYLLLTVAEHSANRLG